MIVLRLLGAVALGFAALFGLFLWFLLAVVRFGLAAAAGVFFIWALISFVLYVATHDPFFLRGTFKMLAMGGVPFAIIVALAYATEEARDA